MKFEYRKQAKNYTEGKDWTVYPRGIHCYYKDLPLLKYIKNRVNKYWSYFRLWSGMSDIRGLIIVLKLQTKDNGIRIWFCFKCWDDITNYRKLNHKNHKWRTNPQK